MNVLFLHAAILFLEKVFLYYVKIELLIYTKNAKIELLPCKNKALMQKYKTLNFTPFQRPKNNDCKIAKTIFAEFYLL